jgi:hypothetical protein
LNTGVPRRIRRDVARFLWPAFAGRDEATARSPANGGIMASTRRRKLKKLRMKKANHGKRPLAGK